MALLARSVGHSSPSVLFAFATECWKPSGVRERSIDLVAVLDQMLHELFHPPDSVTVQVFI
jgi:hypothetical protein